MNPSIPVQPDAQSPCRRCSKRFLELPLRTQAKRDVKWRKRSLHEPLFWFQDQPPPHPISSRRGLLISESDRLGRFTSSRAVIKRSVMFCTPFSISALLVTKNVGCEGAINVRACSCRCCACTPLTTTALERRRAGVTC